MTNFDDDNDVSGQGPRQFDFVFDEETVTSDDPTITVRELIETLGRFPNLDAPVQVFIQRDQNGIALPTLMYTIGYDPNTGDAQIVVVPDLAEFRSTPAPGLFPPTE